MALLTNFTDPRPQLLDNNGNPASGGRVSFYSAGTSELKEVYTAADGLTPAQNPHILDAGGFVRDGGVWLGSGRYKIVVEQTDGAGGWINGWSVDNVAGSDVADGDLVGSFISSIDELRNLDPTEANLVYVTGYIDLADGGEGWFKYDADSNASDNGGTIIAPQGAPALGRWIRIVEQEYLTPQLFGAVDGASTPVADAFTAMINWAKATPLYNNIRVPGSTYDIENDVEFNGDISVIVEDGAYFTSSVTPVLDISCREAVVNVTGAICDNSSIDFSYKPTISRPARIAWWGILAANPAETNLVNWFKIDTDQEIELYEAIGITNQSPTPSNITLDRAVFQPGSSITTGGPIVLTIGEYRNESGRIFLGGMEDYRFTDSVDIADFGLGVESAGYYSVDATKWSALGDSLNSSGGCSVSWSAGSLPFRFESPTISGGFQNKYPVKVLEGCTIRTDSPTDLGSIVAGGYQIFDTLSTSQDVNLATDSAKIEWYGGVAFNVSADNYNPIVSLAKIQNYSADYSKWPIEGANGAYYIDEVVFLTFGSLQDGVFWVRNTLFVINNTTSNNGFQISNINSRFDRCEFTSESLNTTCVFVGGSSTAEFNGCKFNSVFTALSCGGGSLAVYDCVFDVEQQAITSDGQSQIFNSRFLSQSGTMELTSAESQINACSFSDYSKIDIYGDSTLVSNCLFVGSRLYLYNAQDQKVLGCSFVDKVGAPSTESFIVIDGSGGPATASGLIIENNTFSTSTGASNTISTGINVAPSGHKARVVNNASSGYTYNKSTEIIGFVDQASASTTYVFDFTQRGLLPFTGFCVGGNVEPLDGNALLGHWGLTGYPNETAVFSGAVSSFSYIYKLSDLDLTIET